MGINFFYFFEVIDIVSNKELVKHLTAAIKLEQEGVKKYTEFSKKTKNYYGKLMFERLSIEEEKHALILESWKEKLDSLRIEKEFAQVATLTSIKARDIFPVRKKATTGITKDYITALAYAINIEEKSYTFYKELEQMTDIPELKQLFSDLSKFEHEHLNLFKSELEFVQSNPMSF